MRNSRSSSSLSISEGGEGAAAADTTTVRKKGPWTAAEDAILMEHVQKHGEGHWNSVQKNCGLARCGKSCRLRWANHLRPNLKKGSFTPEEEMLILQLHVQLGNKWARMASQLPGRTDNEIKNFWNARIKRRQRAGLPLYQTELQIQRQRKMRLPAITVPPHSPIGSTLSSSKQLPMPLQSPSFEGPWVKRARGGDGLTTSTFQFPMPPSSSSFPNHIMMSSSSSNNNMFHYSSNNFGNYGDIINLSQSPAAMSLYSGRATVELHSSQLLFNGGGGDENGCRLLDALLHEEEPGILSSDDNQIGAMHHYSGSHGEGNDLFLGNFSKSVESSRRWSNGVSLKRDRPPSTHDDISKLFDMLSTPGLPTALDWYNINACTATEGRDISTEGESDGVTSSASSCSTSRRRCPSILRRTRNGTLDPAPGATCPESADKNYPVIDVLRAWL